MGRFLPQLHGMHEYGQLRTARGHALPACIVLEAVVQGSDTMDVQEAVDAWAVGMVALELFSGKLVFDVMQTQEQVPRR